MDERVRALNNQPVRQGGRYVLYWCRWNRRVESNHALLYAAEMANRMNLPLVYALDGDDPNTYANILWCLGLHDRPWPERPIYGTIRSMGRSGMKRKTNVDAYIKEIEHLKRTGKELTR